MSSATQLGCFTSSLERNSRITGLMSNTGVPSIASNPSTSRCVPLTAMTGHVVKPIRFGLFFPRCAKMPTNGRSLRPRGCLASITILSLDTLSKTKNHFDMAKRIEVCKSLFVQDDDRSATPPMVIKRFCAPSRNVAYRFDVQMLSRCLLCH